MKIAKKHIGRKKITTDFSTSFKFVNNYYLNNLIIFTNKILKKKTMYMYIIFCWKCIGVRGNLLLCEHNNFEQRDSSVIY